MAPVSVLIIRAPSLVCRRLAERPEGRAEFACKQLRFLPGREVTVGLGMIEIDQLGIGLLCWGLLALDFALVSSDNSVQVSNALLQVRDYFLRGVDPLS